jgi:hypothetical protein
MTAEAGHSGRQRSSGAGAGRRRNNDLILRRMLISTSGGAPPRAPIGSVGTFEMWVSGPRDIPRCRPVLRLTIFGVRPLRREKTRPSINRVDI